MRWTAAPFVLLLTTLALSGCIGGDDAPDAADDGLADEAAATEQTGSMTGQVVATDLAVIPDALVALTGSGGTPETKTDKQGRYTLNDLAPGKYRVQVTAACCKMVVEEISVKAGEVTSKSFQLDRLTDDDLRVPYMREENWPGFIACGTSTQSGLDTPDGVPSGLSVAVCSLLADTAVEDPNEDFYEAFEVYKGIEELVVVMDWEPVGGVSGGEMTLLVEERDCGFSSCDYEYARISGGPPLRADIDEEAITDDEFKWALIEKNREMQFRVFASGTATVIYQQPFTVYYTAFHYQQAPDGYNPVPDA